MSESASQCDSKKAQDRFELRTGKQEGLILHMLCYSVFSTKHMHCSHEMARRVRETTKLNTRLWCSGPTLWFWQNR